MGIEAPTRGHVRVLGTDVTTVDAPRRRHLRRHFQMVFQDPFGSLDPRQKVARIVAEPLALDRLSREETHERVIEVLEAVGLKASDTGQVSARVLGWATPAHRDRTGARHPAGPDRRRRAACRRWTSRCRRRC